MSMTLQMINSLRGYFLPHCGLVNIDLGQHWLKQLPEPILTSHQLGSAVFPWEQFYNEMCSQATILCNEFENHTAASPRGQCVNSLAPGGFENIFQNVFFKLISWIDTLSNSCETALRSMPQNPSDDKSTLVQVMAWCRQAASHYLSQCCPKSLSPYGVTRPQWVNDKDLGQEGLHWIWL